LHTHLDGFEAAPVFVWMILKFVNGEPVGRAGNSVDFPAYAETAIREIEEAGITGEEKRIAAAETSGAEKGGSAGLEKVMIATAPLKGPVNEKKRAIGRELAGIRGGGHAGWDEPEEKRLREGAGSPRLAESPEP